MESLIMVKDNTEITDAVFLQLYKKVLPIVARYIGKRGGTLEEAKDIFQDALLLYYERVLREKVVIQQSEEAYIFGIARHLWIRRAGQRVATEPLTEQVDQATSTAERIADQYLMQSLKQAGERCMSLLKTFYYDKLTTAALAKQFGYSSERSATVQKFKCLEKVRDFIKTKALRYEDFIE